MRAPLVEIQKIEDDAELYVMQNPLNIPFPIKRVYVIRDCKTHEARGHHAHKKTRQVIFALQGSFELYLENSPGRISQVKVFNPQYGFLIEPMVWHEMRHISPDAIILVLASEDYEPGDYIREKESWLKLLNS